MGVGVKLYRLGLGLTRKFLFLWVRTRVLDDSREVLEGLGDGPVCFVTERPGLAEAAVLDEVCIRAGLKAASRGLRAPGLNESRAVLHVRRPGRTFLKRSRPPDLSRLERIVEAVDAGRVEDVRLVPVSVFWGRSPDKERGLLKLIFSEDWAIAGRMRKLFQVVVHGRNVLVEVSPPVSVAEALAEGQPAGQTVRKLARVMRVHFRRLRAAAIGPDLSHRRTMVNQVLASHSVRNAIRREVEVNGVPEHKAVEQARRYVQEIAADFSYPFIRVMERLLARLWDRLYEGVEVHHLDPVKKAAEGREIVYVPCHRSHFDYLLLSFVVYRNGLMCPHIAAGINLNLPVIGSFLRKGGAFYLRRSFKDNALYAAVFHKYLSLNLAKGVPIEYFIEGGRSRTGRLLPAKAGMLSMTVRSYVRRPERPLVFVPVYFGYERLFEAESFVSELSGRPKQRETLVGFLKSLRALRQRFGKVYVNFGEPIELTDLLDAHRPGWREEDPRRHEKPTWLQPVVRDLGTAILEGINSAAAVSPIGLVAAVLLATHRNSMLESELVHMLDLYLKLLAAAPYSPRVTVPAMTGRQILEYAEGFGLLQRRAHKLGDIIYMEDHKAIVSSYARNNITHLLVLPSLVACSLYDTPAQPMERVHDLVARIYPYVRGELFLHWEEDALAAAVDRVVEAMVRQGLLARGEDGDGIRRPPANTPEAVQLSVLARHTLHTLERYYVTVALLLKHGPGTLTQRKLEELCQLMAQRISLLYQLSAPEFFDRNLFRSFISELKRHGVIETDEAGHIHFGDALLRADEDALVVLGEQLRHDILQVVHI